MTKPTSAQLQAALRGIKQCPVSKTKCPFMGGSAAEVDAATRLATSMCPFLSRMATTTETVAPLPKPETNSLASKCPFHRMFSPSVDTAPATTAPPAANAFPSPPPGCPAHLHAAEAAAECCHRDEVAMPSAATAECTRSGESERLAEFASAENAMPSPSLGSSLLCEEPAARLSPIVEPTDYDAFTADTIAGLKAEGRYRVFRRIERKRGELPRATADEKPNAINFCSNDYLCMGQTPQVTAAAEAHAQNHRTGMPGIPSASHRKLESEVAALHSKEEARVFNSCYTANEAAINAIVRTHPDCTIISDSSNHASMIQGIRQSGAPKLLWQHNDLEHLDTLLATLPRDDPKLVVFESVYSMDGSVAPIADIVELCERHNAMSFLDEVHAVGLYGREGAGVAQELGVMHRVDVISGTLGKAYGVIGGYVALGAQLATKMDGYIAQHLPYQHDAYLPPPVTEAAMRSVQELRGELGRQTRRDHQANAALLKGLFVEEEIPVQASSSHIVPVLVGDPAKATEAAEILLERHGIYVQAINYPTVPRGTERLRFTPGPLHTPPMQADLIKSLKAVFAEVGIDAEMEAQTVPLPACSKLWTTHALLAKMFPEDMEGKERRGRQQLAQDQHITTTLPTADDKRALRSSTPLPMPTHSVSSRRVKVLGGGEADFEGLLT